METEFRPAQISAWHTGNVLPDDTQPDQKYCSRVLWDIWKFQISVTRLQNLDKASSSEQT